MAKRSTSARREVQHSGLVIVGGGGHGLVVAEAALASGRAVAGFLDDNPSAVLGVGREGRRGLARLGGMGDVAVLRGSACAGWIVAIGDVIMRERLIGRLAEAQGVTLPLAVVHPSAWISDLAEPDLSAEIGPGCYVGPRAVVHSRAIVAAHAIINSGAIIEHECHVGEGTHVAPGTVLGGRASVGAWSLVGLGARVLPGVRIGSRATVAAGAVVTQEVPDGATVAGVPARRLTSERAPV